MSKKLALPVLPFGEDIAIVHDSAQHFGDLIDSVFPGVDAYDSKVQGFRSKTVTLKMSKATLVATAISPTHVERRNNPSLTFMLPLAGREAISAEVGSRKFTWGLGHGGMFLPQTEEQVLGAGGFRSQLMWSLDRTRLLETARTMLGTDSVDLRLDEARVLPREVAGVSLDTSIGALLPLVNAYRKHPQMLSNVGVEDLLYRQTVMWLRPDIFQIDEISAEPAGRHRGVINELCEYIIAHLADRLTLTDLEAVSGLSARSLQIAFNEHFACSPMNWVKEQRLLKVRHDLLHSEASNDVSVEVIALAAGFQTMPTFFLAYKQRFGETPGNTRKR